VGKEEKEEMTDFDHIKLDLKAKRTEDLYRHIEDRSIIFDKAVDIFNHIDKQFSRSFPWMYMFLTYKSKGKRILFHSLRSVPIIRMRSSIKDSIMLHADWDGDNVDDFFKPKKPKAKKKQTWENFYDKMEDREQEYDKKYKSPYVMADGNPPERYMAQLRMVINDISSVHVYNSGFEVQTGGPIDLTCIKRSSILKLASLSVPEDEDETGFTWNLASDGAIDNSIALEKRIVNGILQKEHFVLPSEIIHVKLLRATWNKKRQKSKNKEVDSWLLGEQGKTEAEVEVDVGQVVNQNIILD
jgi:hypothetical protein